MIDFLELVVHGVMGPLPKRATLAEVVDSFGDPEIHTPARKSYPEMIVYGDLEFRLRQNQLHVATLSLVSDRPHLPNGIRVLGLPTVTERSRDVIEQLLRQHEVEFETDAIMSDESQVVLVTEHGVHLVFVDGKLVRIGVEECRKCAD